MYTQGIYSLQQLLPQQWQLFKKIRLEALQSDPSVFGSTYEREAAFPEEEWQRRMSNPDAAFFGLYHREELIGVTGIIVMQDHPGQALLIASYIRTPFRGNNLSAMFYKARIDWATTKNIRKLIVSHRASNGASKAANQKAGFVYTHTEAHTWPDRTEEAQVFYELNLPG